MQTTAQSSVISREYNAVVHAENLEQLPSLFPASILLRTVGTGLQADLGTL